MTKNHHSNLGVRAFINQPSALQALHKYHGVSGIAFDIANSRDTICFYPVCGEIVSMVIPRSSLAIGHFNHNWK